LISLLIWKSVFSVGFLNPIDGGAEAKEYYDFYIDTILQFQKLFSYTGSIQSVLELPYCLFQDLIIAKIKDQKLSKKKIDKMQNKNKNMVTYGDNDKL